uniref:Uncharacterized protein n=1 Tax=Chromera velia CCMP2878 TaxID=1169474 RepID=A0A0G4FKF6_9ALVE|eukprot:Cvel_17424.t1-p1 / transcript=Cvel_17424.t1 / gene=Cvel_17424 / organism=Chromera_velia_CCMP2878 / gene_product=hypothetical protein / transcript_product=hypothetical protein / location=Cvel_scaffold1388:36811-44637(+) / protein_length=513 / sequence_SO=supercontig / SO=protein_coding / is_pseudo=false
MNHTDDAYNKSTGNGFGTLVGNWMEEECLRTGTGHGRTKLNTLAHEIVCQDKESLSASQTLMQTGFVPDDDNPLNTGNKTRIPSCTILDNTFDRIHGVRKTGKMSIESKEYGKTCWGENLKMARVRSVAGPGTSLRESQFEDQARQELLDEAVEQHNKDYSGYLASLKSTHQREHSLATVCPGAMDVASAAVSGTATVLISPDAAPPEGSLTRHSRTMRGAALYQERGGEGKDAGGQSGTIPKEGPLKDADDATLVNQMQTGRGTGGKEGLSLTRDEVVNRHPIKKEIPMLVKLRQLISDLATSKFGSAAFLGVHAALQAMADGTSGLIATSDVIGFIRESLGVPEEAVSEEELQIFLSILETMDKGKVQVQRLHDHIRPQTPRVRLAAIEEAVQRILDSHGVPREQIDDTLVTLKTQTNLNSLAFKVDARFVEEGVPLNTVPFDDRTLERVTSIGTQKLSGIGGSMPGSGGGAANLAVRVQDIEALLPADPPDLSAGMAEDDAGFFGLLAGL